MHVTNKKQHYMREHAAIHEPVERWKELDRCTVYEAVKRRRRNETEEVRGEMKITGHVFVLRVHMYSFSARPPHVCAPPYVWHWHTNPNTLSKTPGTIPPFYF